MKKKSIFLGVLITCFILMGVVNADLVKAEGTYILSYHVGSYSFQTDTSGNVFAEIDGRKYNYAEQWSGQGFLEKLLALENQNVVYELHNNEIVATYTIAEVLKPKVVIEPDVEDGLIYHNGKFSKKNFDLVVKVSNNLQKDFEEKDLLMSLNSIEKERLYFSVKSLSIEPSDSVNFGSSGWWFWKEYQRNISEKINEKISVGETKKYNYKVNLEDKSALTGLEEYCINLYVKLIYDIGEGNKETAKIKVGNLDYQKEVTEEKKKNSDSGQALDEASTKLSGLRKAIQFSEDCFSNSQVEQINEFVNTWISELILAKYADKSSLKEEISEKIVNKWLKNLGLNTSVLTIPGQIKAATFLETETKNGEKVFIEFYIELMNFDFGNSGVPTMATGSGSATVYNMKGEEVDSSIIVAAYADVCAFCEQLQKVAKNTIFDATNKYFGILVFGTDSATDSVAEALSSQMTLKLLNSKYSKDIFKTVNAKEMKSILDKCTSKAVDYGAKKIYKLITTPSKKKTEVSIKCPVDVKVYDNDGQLCSVITDNEVDYTYSDIYSTVVGEQKNIYLVGDDYTFELTGTGNGTMDYIVKEFDEDDNIIRQIAYKRVALTEGCKYYSNVPESEGVSSILFDLADENGNTISPTSGADEEYKEDDIKIIDSGICGENLTWTMHSDGVLWIRGTGDMYDYENTYEPLNPSPWKGESYSIKYVIIDDGVTSIGNDSFFECSSLCHIYIPNTVTSIGDYALAHCRSLHSIVIPKSVNSLGEGVFVSKYTGSSLTINRIIMQGNAPMVFGNNTFGNIFAQLKIPENALGYDKRPWTQMAIYSANRIYGKCGDNLTWELNEDGVLNIEGSGSMYHYTSDVNFPPVGAMAQWAPWKNISDQISEIVINAENAQIGDNAFSSCRSVSNVSISFGVTNIGYSAFNGCNNLERIDIPESVTNIEGSAFNGCSNLKRINIPESVTNIGSSAFNGCSSLERIDIPNGVTDIGFSTFFGCKKLIRVTIPSSVTHIAYDAFSERVDEYDHQYIPIPLNNLIIYCPPNSYAEIYAKEYGFQFVYYDENNGESTPISYLAQAREELQGLCKEDLLSLGQDMKNYLSDDQLNAMSSYLFAWMAEISHAYTFSGNADLKKGMLYRLGIDSDVDFALGTAKAVTQLQAETPYGKKTIAVTLNFDTDLSGNRLVFGDMEYEVIEKEGIPDGVPTKGKFSTVSYDSMEAFSESMIKALDYSITNTYQLSKRKDDILVNFYIDKITMDVVGIGMGSYSDNLYTLYEKPIQGNSKKITVECPVNVFIYDLNGNLCGSIVDNKINQTNTDIGMEVVGDTKIFNLLGNDYYIELQGTDSGSMTYTIEELTQDQNRVRAVQFVNLPLENKKLYTGYILEPLYIDSRLYSLQTADQAVYADTDTYQSALIKVERIEIRQDSISLNLGKTLQLNAYVYPENASNKNLRWSSSDEQVATVDGNGKVTAIGAGQATITVKSLDGSGVSASCVITVTKLADNPTGGNSSGGSSSGSTGGSSSGGSSGGSTGGSSSGESSGGSTGGSSGGTTGSDPNGGSTGNDSDSSTSENDPDNGNNDELQVKLLYYIVDFNANGGNSLSRKTMTLLMDDTLGILPKTQRKQYDFKGWYTQKSGGEKVTPATVLNASTTLYAQWTETAKSAKPAKLSLTAKKGRQMKVSYKKVSGASGYQIAYSTNKKFASSATKKVTTSSTSKTLKNLKKGKTYYVRVRAYQTDSAGNKVYGTYSGKKSIKIKA